MKTTYINIKETELESIFENHGITIIDSVEEEFCDSDSLENWIEDMKLPDSSDLEIY
jgi:hypothetical protein